MDVVAAHAVDSIGLVELEGVRLVQGPQPGQVEHRTEVDEERVVALAGEDLGPTVLVQRVHGRGRQGVVVRRGPRTDVVGRRGEAGGEHLPLPVVDAGH